MGEVLKLLYVVVVDQDREDNNGDSSERERCSFRYTRSVLQSTLQLMGCKPRHAFKISRRVFEDLKDAKSDKINNSIEAQKVDFEFELYKRKTTVIISREKFINIVCNALSTYKYVGPNQREDLILACRIRERKESITILLCGTSGCGKSTLSALLGHRLGITTVVSTDSIRHMMRSFVDANQNPLLWASTYHAGDFLDPIAVAQSKAKKKAKKLLSLEADENTNEGEQCSAIGSDSSEIVISKKQMAIEGYKAQSEMVIDSLDRLITSWEDKKESVIIEGVHLSLNFVMGLMQKHPSIIPFMLYISNESKHSERFAIRAKYMTLDPSKNKYIKYIKNIRAIQEYLLKLAEKHLVPKINNTNIDKSMASIHATIFSALKSPDPLYDPLTNTLPLLNQCFNKQCEANYLSSKGMFQLIQRQGSSRHLMALVNGEGVVEKAWPIRPKMDQGPLYGPVGNIGSFEEVNLQFGGFGISAWPSDVGSVVGSVAGNGRIDTGIDRNRNKGVSSCSGSPNDTEGAAKELVDKISMSSEEEQDLPDAESDEDLSDNEKNVAPDDMEGSVDEDSTKTDEEYEDLEYLTDDENMKNSEDLFVKKDVLQNSTERKMRIRRRSHSDASKLYREKNLTKSLSLCK